MRYTPLFLLVAAALGPDSQAQTPSNCLETNLSPNTGIALTDNAIFFDLDAVKDVTVSAIRHNVNTTGMVGTTVQFEVWTKPGTAVGFEQDMSAWTLQAAESAVVPPSGLTEFRFATPIPFDRGTSGVALAISGARIRYDTGNGSNEVYDSPDGVLRITGHAAQGALFSGGIAQPRVWSGSLCYDAPTAPCLETQFASNNGGNPGGAVYFDLDLSEACTFSGLDTNYPAALGTPVGMEVWARVGSAVGNTGSQAGWGRVAVDDGTATAAGQDLPTRIRFENTFSLPAGTFGVALVSVGSRHRYTNGNGRNESIGTSDGVMQLTAVGAANVPFSSSLFSPRVWNGSLCYDAPDHCVVTTTAGGRRTLVGGTVFFDVNSSIPADVTGFKTNLATAFNPAVRSAGVLAEFEVWGKPGSFVGFETDQSAWQLLSSGNAPTVGALPGRLTDVKLNTPFTLPASPIALAIVHLNVAPEYSDAGTAGQQFESADGVLQIRAGSSTSGAFAGGPFSPRIWNGALCYQLPFIGADYCDPAVPNSTGKPAEMFAIGSTAVSDNDVVLVATNLPTNASAFFLTSQSLIEVPTAGGAQGTLCIAGPSMGRYVGPGQIQNSGGLGGVDLRIDLNQHPTPTGLVSVLPGETWNFQCWYRDANPGSTSNFSSAYRILFE